MVTYAARRWERMANSQTVALSRDSTSCSVWVIQLSAHQFTLKFNIDSLIISSLPARHHLWNTMKITCSIRIVTLLCLCVFMCGSVCVCVCVCVNHREKGRDRRELPCLRKIHKLYLLNAPIVTNASDCSYHILSMDQSGCYIIKSSFHLFPAQSIIEWKH